MTSFHCLRCRSTGKSSSCAKIRARNATTTPVKVKAHSGVPLNEAADVAADLGCSSDILCFPMTCDQVYLLRLPHQHCQPVDFNKAVQVQSQDAKLTASGAKEAL
eukprot:2762024-Rhodomonas_salina.1